MSEPLQAQLPKLPSVYRLVALDCVDSTNDEARRLAEAGAEDGTLVWALEQRKGRGRQGRSFDSPRGNLFLSLVLRPECSVAEAPQLGFVAAAAVREAVGSLAHPVMEVRYKWPNDVLFNGRKGAGILLESLLGAGGGLDWLVLGVGVNVASHPEGLEPPATSLHFEGAPTDLGAAELLEAFARYFLNLTSRWLDEGFQPIRRSWLRHVQGLGEEIRVRLPGETVAGLFEDLDETGALVLRLPDGGRRLITAGDVGFGA